MTPYEILKVPKDADADTIKNAFRILASKYHPDREGGSHDTAAEINDAYAVIGDPERRAHFDKTGMQASTSMEMRQQAEALLAISSAINDAPFDVVASCMALMQQKLNNLSAATQNLKTRRTYLQAQRAKIKVKADGSLNLFHGVIDQQLTALEEQLQKNYEMDDVVSGAFKLVTDYQTLQIRGPVSFSLPQFFGPSA